MPRKLRHPWLPADDPANCERNGRNKGYWVPKPAEIEIALERMRGSTNLHQPDFSRIGNLRECALHTLQKPNESFNEILCDCPYWGTEFVD